MGKIDTQSSTQPDASLPWDSTPGGPVSSNSNKKKTRWQKYPYIFGVPFAPIHGLIQAAFFTQLHAQTYSSIWDLLGALPLPEEWKKKSGSQLEAASSFVNFHLSTRCMSGKSPSDDAVTLVRRTFVHARPFSQPCDLFHCSRETVPFFGRAPEHLKEWRL